MRSSVIYDQSGPIAHLRMNRPDVLNVLDEELAEDLLAALEKIAKDPASRVVVLSGEGRSFMAGGDLACFRSDLSGAPRTATRLIDLFHGVMRTIKSMRQPVIAAVQGPVAGGGVGLALACDLVIAADNASFLSAYTRLGTVPDGGTSWSLTRGLGARRALAFMLLNDRLDANAAHALGLVNEVVPLEALSRSAQALAERLALTSVQATAGVKQLVQSAQIETFDDQLELEKEGFVAAAATSDFAEGINAFFERRPPRFS